LKIKLKRTLPLQCAADYPAPNKLEYRPMTSYDSPLKAIAVRRQDAANMIGEGVSKIDMLIATGQIQGKKSGRNLLITVESLERYVAGLPPADLRIERKYQKPARPAPDAAKG
jgi:hypothetical protein